MDTNSENVVEVKDKVIESVKVFDKKKLSIIKRQLHIIQR